MQLNGQTTLVALVEARARATPEAVLLVDDAGRRMTCGELSRESERVAVHLSRMGVGAGSVVSWILPTGIDAVVVMVALSRLGTIQNPIIPMYGAREVGHIVREASVDAIIQSGSHKGTDYRRLAEAAASECERRPRVLDIDDVVRGTTSHDGGARGDVPLHRHLRGASWIFYTSGSTSLPKGVLHNDSTLLAVSGGMVERLQMTERDRNGVAFPIAHIGGPINLMASLICGAALILIEAFDPVASSETLRREGVTMAGSGTAFHLAYLDAQRARPDERLFPHLRCCPGGGAPKPPGLHVRVKAELGGSGIVSGWGLTEAPVLTMGSPTDPDAKLSESEGRPLRGVQVKVVDLAGGEAPSGHSGELRAHAPQLMLGYVDASLDASAFDDDGYLRTGDIGLVDGDGYVRITGRLKDVVIRKGENIGTAEVEDVLRGHPLVLDAAVIGLADERSGERVCAILETTGECSRLDVRKVGEYLAQRGLRRIAWPEQVEVVTSLPRTVAGKIDKAKLIAEFSE